MKKNWLNGMLIPFFLLCITLPLLLADFQGGEISAGENRYLATFPTAKRGMIAWRDGLENWIGDNAFGRKLGLRLTASADYWLSGQHGDNVIEGKEQWLFLLPPYDYAEWQNTNRPSEKTLALWSEQYLDIQKGLESEGIQFLLCMWPRKYTVYPEMMPDNLKRLEGPSNYELIRRSFYAHPQLHFVEPYDELTAAKKNGLTYSKARDTGHWSNYGAFLGYRVLMEKAKELIPELRVLTEADFHISEQTFETKLDNGFSTTEQDVGYALKQNNANADKSFFERSQLTMADRWQSYQYYTNTDATLPKAIIVGDSYMWMFMLDNLAQSFSELVFIHIDDIAILEPLSRIIRPDLVVFAGLGSAVGLILTRVNAEE